MFSILAMNSLCVKSQGEAEGNSGMNAVFLSTKKAVLFSLTEFILDSYIL